MRRQSCRGRRSDAASRPRLHDLGQPGVRSHFSPLCGDFCERMVVGGAPVASAGMDDAERALAEAERVLRQNWREGDADGVTFAYTEPSPGRYPWQWYWDSLLRGDRQPPLRAGASAGRAGEPARRPAPGRLHRPHDLLGHAGLRLPPRSSTTSPPAAPSRPSRSSRRCSPGPGGSRSATRRPSRGSAPRRTGCSPTATSKATACSGSSRGTSRGSTPRPSSNRSGDAARSAAPASRCWSRATAGSAGTRDGSATAAARCSARPWSTPSGRSPCRASAAPRRRRPWSRGSGTRSAACSSTRPSRAASAPPRSPGRAWRRWRSPTCRRRSAAGWSSSTC